VAADDEALLSRWRDGDGEAGEQLIGRHYDAIVRFFQTKAHRDVDDLVQRTFLRCAEAIKRYRGDGTFRAFLFGVARNLLLELYRGRRRDADHVDPDFGVSCVRDLDPGASTAFARREEQRVMVDALQHIPLDLQLALELYYWEELSVGELAEVLAIPPGTVKSRLFRARKLLKEQMERTALPPEVERSVRETYRDLLDVAG
jgi:RNA polymerase sigma-70 factor (ECF subfamily)